jgi:polyisoprenoid-binding protein YceI
LRQSNLHVSDELVLLVSEVGGEDNRDVDRMNQRCHTLGLASLLILLASGSVAAEPSWWQIERGDVRILVPLKPGGAFTATAPSLSGTLTLDQAKPARLTGDVSMDLATIDTGIGLRNQHLRENYLEVAKGKGFDKAVLSEILMNDADGEAFEGRTPFTGMLLLHGVKHPVEGTAEIHRDGLGRRVQAEFPLVLTDFQITPPLYLGVGVANRLLVKARFTAVPAPKSGK